MRIRQRIQSDDEGAVLVTVGIFLLALLVFAAWAVDISAVLVERRSAQNTADISALSGAQLTLNQLPANAVLAAETEVRRISAVNFGTTGAMWDGCTDTDRPVRFTIIAPGTDCVSFSHSLLEIRVRVPDTDVPTVFAGVIGINSIATSAFAEVTTGTGDYGGVLPFGLPPGAAGEVCLKAGPQAFSSSPCNGPDEGNFGFLDFKLYQGLSPNRCSTGNLITNIAAGVDHFLDIRSSVLTSIHDFDYCDNVSALPDRTNAQTGSTSTLQRGLVSSDNPLARLRRVSLSGNPTELVLGQDLDDKPLWQYITAGSGACNPGPIHDHDAMAACIVAYNSDAVTNPLSFSDDILESARFAYVPEVHQTFVDGGAAGIYEFVVFHPVYIQTIFANCTATACNEFNPGEADSTITGNGNGGNGVKVATVIVIPLDTLSIEAQNRRPGYQGLIEYLLTR